MGRKGKRGGDWGEGEGSLPFSLSPSHHPPPLFAPATQAMDFENIFGPISDSE